MKERVLLNRRPRKLALVLGTNIVLGLLQAI